MTRAFGMDSRRVPATTPVKLLSRVFTADLVSDVRHAVRGQAETAGLTGDSLDGFVIAVHELVTNAVRHGGGRGRVQLRNDGENLSCEVTDHGSGFPAGVPEPGGPPPVNAPGGRGLLLARELTDTMLISNSPVGVTVSVAMCLPAAPQQS